MSDAVQQWHPQGEYEIPPYEIVVETYDDEDGQHSAVEIDEYHTGHGAAFVDPRSDNRTRASYTDTNTRYTDGRQEYQPEPRYLRPRVHITGNTEAISQQRSPCPKLHIRHTSHGSYREAPPQQASPRPPTIAHNTPINDPERPMYYFDHYLGERQYRYYFHRHNDAGMGVWRLDPPYRSSDTTGMSRSETPRPRARDIPYRRPDGASDFGRYLNSNEVKVMQWREDVASQAMAESTSAREVRASQTAGQNGARNGEEAHHWRRDRNQ